MAKALNLTIDGIDWNVRKLKKAGKLKRIGPDKGGHWEVVEKQYTLFRKIVVDEYFMNIYEYRENYVEKS